MWKLAKKDLELVGVNSSDLNLGDNILLSDWVPQNDLLGHPNMKAFFTQGGTNSYNEVCTALCMYGGVTQYVTNNCGGQASCCYLQDLVCPALHQKNCGYAWRNTKQMVLLQSRCCGCQSQQLPLFSRFPLLTVAVQPCRAAAMSSPAPALCCPVLLCSALPCPALPCSNMADIIWPLAV